MLGCGHPRRTFHTVRCRDLSSTGISFWIDVPPPVDIFVVRFPMDGDKILVQARVAHTTETDI